jgi:hypothetical protein
MSAITKNITFLTDTHITALQEIIAAVFLRAIKFRSQGRKHFTLQIKVCY